MGRINQIVQWQLNSSPPMMIGGRAITLQSRALSVRLPFGGFVWNRPASIIVDHEGNVEQLPVQDVTRSALVTLALSTITLTLFARLIKRRKGGKVG